MSGTEVGVPCPFCGKTLYVTAPLAPGVNAKRSDGPELKNDGKGNYLVCPNEGCDKRVAMDVGVSPAGTATIFVSPFQP